VEWVAGCGRARFSTNRETNIGIGVSAVGCD
jgi:hypothetical protein